MKKPLEIGDKFTHIHFGLPQIVTITEIKDGEYYLSNDGHNGGSWYFPEQLYELNKRHLNPENYSL